MRRGRALGIGMAERVRLGRTPDDGCPARHCWVADPADRSGVKRPGLLVAWRRRQDGGWEAQVVYVARLRADAWATVEEWLPAELVAPA